MTKKIGEYEEEKKMALINGLEKISRNAHVQNEVDASYNILNKDGRKYIQINTYGSKERKAKGVVSQTIQFNEQSAKQLAEIINREIR
jgi:hypothetical protein